MKTLILSFLIACAAPLCAKTEQMYPLHQEQGKLLGYRIVFIESSLIEIKKRLSLVQTDEKTRAELDYFILLIEYNLGYPCDSEDLECGYWAERD